MKKKVTPNNNGVIICDSIVMSVKKKRPDIRKPEAILIAVMGFVSVIMSFLGMFHFNYNHSMFMFTAVALSIFYIIISAIGKRALWVMLVSVIAFVGIAYQKINTIAEGFKFIYNIIYSDSYHTEIHYYKSLNPLSEEQSVTVFFLFCLWLLAMIIYFFTIYHPNPVLPLLATFPILETGLYNGIEIPIFWGVMTVAYWLALLSMSTIDIGEINGGNSGFVRKDNTFFPKRQMRLKVTEKCGMFIIITILIITAVSACMINFSGYKRSDELNRKRVEIRDAVNSFSFENIAESVSRLTSAFGFEFNYENHKLGTTDRLKFKNTTDLIVTFDQPQNHTIYLKDYIGSSYSNNEWSDLSDSKYKDTIFTDFDKFGVYPQDFASLFSRNIIPDIPTNTVWIKSKLRDDKSFAPYGTDNFGNLTYDEDRSVSSKRKNESEFSYKFVSPDNESIASFLGDPMENIYSASLVYNDDIKEKLVQYCTENGVFAYDDVFYTESEMPFYNDNYAYSNGNVLIAQLLQSRYRDFVYENYLDVPDNENMQEVREAYADILSYDTTYASDKIEVLKAIRERIDEQNTYSLSPGKTPSNRDFINYFLLENHKGYCIHYATSGVMLARMAGIPARYATGYVIVGEDFSNQNHNADGSYTISVKDNRSHAWAEVYLDGYGWVPFEFTAGYSDNSLPVETTAPHTSAETNTETTASTSSQERPTTSRRQTVQQTTTVQTTTVTSKAVGIAPDNHGSNGTGGTFPKVLKTILIVVASAGTIVFIVWARRKIILNSRTRKFTTGGNSARTTAMYNYAEKLLATQKLKQEDLNFKDFAETAEKNFGGKIFENGSFSQFMDISLRAGFSNSTPDSSEVDFCNGLVNDMSAKIYEQSNFIHRFIMKFVTVLIK
ncbi:MAG: transglutaminase-like domain-containing protein [Ruminococcus flavefaciens]|nr:transglutaminase-like domain-containing protein [Ruminococcus flavefaciens]